jgi:pilus assembly protein CpaF
MEIDVFIQSEVGSRMQRIRLDGPLSIGTHEQNIVRLEGDYVARLHAIVEILPDGLRIEDRSSTGTMVGDNLIRKRAVEAPHGTLLSIGTYSIRITLVGAPQQPAPPPYLPTPFAPLQPAALQARPQAVTPFPPTQTVPVYSPDPTPAPPRASRVIPTPPPPRAPSPSTSIDNRLTPTSPIKPARGSDPGRSHPPEPARGPSLDEIGLPPALLDPIRALLEDPSVSEVLINGPAQVFVERRGQLESTPSRYASRDALLAALRALSETSQQELFADGPLLALRWPDGFRLEAVLPPAAPEGPVVSIRRAPRGEMISMDRLVDMDTLTYDAAQLLRAAIAARVNVVVAGGPSSGKTTLLAALTTLVPGQERVILVEGERELSISRKHLVRLEAGVDGPRGVGARALVEAALRLRPDRLILGELRGGETSAFIEALTSGYAGLSSVRATHPPDALTRIETLCAMDGTDMPVAALRRQIASGIGILVHMKRGEGGARRVTHVTEVLGYEPAVGSYATQDLFVRIDRRGGQEGDLLPTGAVPQFLPRLRDHGVELPPSLTRAIEERREKR